MKVMNPDEGRLLLAYHQPAGGEGSLMFVELTRAKPIPLRATSCIGLRQRLLGGHIEIRRLRTLLSFYIPKGCYLSGEVLSLRL